MVSCVVYYEQTFNERDGHMEVTPRLPLGYTGEIVQFTCSECGKSFFVMQEYIASHPDITYCHECSFLMDIDETIARSHELLRQLREQEEKDAAFADFVTRFKMLMERHFRNEEAEPQTEVQQKKKIPVTCSQCGKYLGSTKRKQPVKVWCAECDPINPTEE